MRPHLRIDPARLLSALADAVAVIDGEGILLWINAAAERIFEGDVRNLVGTSVLGLVHPEDAGVAVASLESVRGKHVGTPIEVRLKTARGWKLVEVIGSNELENPAISGLVLSIRDLTERRRWEIASDETARFRALVHNASTILMLLDPSGTIESVSAVITRLLGVDQELLEGRPLSDFVLEAHRERLEEAISRAVHVHTPGARPESVEVEMICHPEGSVPFELNIVNLLDDPTVAGLVVSAHDISRVRALIGELRDAHAQLLRRERLSVLGEMASVISHELRNPLAAASNALFLVHQRLVKSEDRDLNRHVETAERGIGRAVALSEDLLAFVRERNPEPKAIDLRVIVDEILESSWPPKEVVLEVEVPPLVVEADPAQLTQMLTNLVTNAYQAMPDGGTLSITASEEDRFVVLALRDSGSGIDPQLAAHLFEPFVTTKPMGTGLGLAIVKRLAEAHGGSVSVENASQGGAVATLNLPRLAIAHA